jgi:primosomal protein N' (replication factor Y) (superfamily II helicase)
VSESDPNESYKPGSLFPDAFEERPAKAAKKEKPKRPAKEYPLYCSVALNRPVHTEFTYGVPDELAEHIQVGMRVSVGFGGRGAAKREVGVVVSVSKHCLIDLRKLRPITNVLDRAPLVDTELLGLTAWMAETYACAWGEALAILLPAPLKREATRRRVRFLVIHPDFAEQVPADVFHELESKQPKQHRLLRMLLEVGGRMELVELLRKTNLSDAPAKSLAKRGLVKIEYVEQTGAPLWVDEAAARPTHETLSEDQAAAVQRIAEVQAGEAGHTFLLHGVTGSGKTEVYLRTIQEALDRGKGAILLVPEIVLTPQTVAWFRARFGEVAVLHSRMTDVQRLGMWMRVKSGEARVVVGARSALFAPVENLGVIILDEEHEPSFKQDSSPRYHAREVAVERARRTGAVCLLGSATPSLESWDRARRGEYERLLLRTRVGGGEMPRVDIVDMKLEKPGPGESRLFSRHLVQELNAALGRKEQGILFLNRRGFSPVMWCPNCKETISCAHCDVSLTWHRRVNRLICHSCCEEQVAPKACPACTAPGMRMLGVGSEQVESALRSEFPDARIQRMDSDTMHRREDYENCLEAFGRGELDLLVGTQMIAKGLDFPRVTVVGIVSADTSLHLPDFRASERTYQLVSQVAGRAGRGELKGRIFVQTNSPEHPSLQFAAKHDFEGFAKVECELRAELGYPPTGRLLRAIFEDEDADRVDLVAAQCAEWMGKALEGFHTPVLGPAPAPMSLLRGRHRRHILIKASLRSERGPEAFALARRALVAFALENRSTRVIIDVDPASLF